MLPPPECQPDVVYHLNIEAALSNSFTFIFLPMAQMTRCRTGAYHEQLLTLRQRLLGSDWLFSFGRGGILQTPLGGEKETRFFHS